MAEKKLTEKEVKKKIRDLKIELLRSPTKKGRVKKEIARLLTVRNEESRVSGKKQTETKLAEDKE
ncbi:hypothetical protein KAT36_01975 [Candidatus Pacearchaeota archaeon]|nr:hypothetical protein [Candidatus Pacearchaeota archaeon]